MSSADLNRYIKEHLKRQPKTLSMSQIEELVEYDAWLDEQRGLTQRAADEVLGCPSCSLGLCPDGNGGYVPCTICGNTVQPKSALHR